MKRKNSYHLLDEVANGVFTVKKEDKIDMKKLRDYCKTNKKRYSDLSEEEINQFIKK